MYFTVVKCPSLTNLDHGFASSSNDSVYGDHVTVTCDVGYELEGQGQPSMSVECLATGNWSLDLISCVPVTCPSPPHVGNATQIATGISYGSVVVFTCPRGYFMGRTSEATFEGSRVSTATIHCQADALWSDEPENCLG